MTHYPSTTKQIFVWKHPSTPLTTPNHSRPHPPQQNSYERFLWRLNKAKFGAKLELAEYFTLLRDCVQRKEKDESLITVMERMEIANIPKEATLIALWKAFSVFRNTERAQQVLRIIGEMPAWKLNTFFKDHTRLEVVLRMLTNLEDKGTLCAEFQQYPNEIYQLFQWAKMSGKFSTHAYNSIISGLMGASMLDKAIDVALTMEYGMVDDGTFEALQEGFRKNNLRHEHFTLLEIKEAWKKRKH